MQSVGCSIAGPMVVNIDSDQVEKSHVSKKSKTKKEHDDDNMDEFGYGNDDNLWDEDTNDSKNDISQVIQCMPILHMCDMY